jgi:hypothetical protein
MNDLHDRLARIAGPAAAPATDVVDADLDRGRRALQRRRTRQAAAGSACAVAVIAGAIAFAALPASPSTPDALPIGGIPAAGQPAASTAPGVDLIPYRGKQPKAFTIGTIPDGWFIQSSDDYSVVIAPDEAKRGGPNVDPSTNPLYDPHDFTGKITVMLQSSDQDGAPDGTEVRVGDRKGVLVKSPPGETPDGTLPTRADGDTGWTLWVEQPSGVYLLVQYWEGLGLSQDQMAELGAGVTVKKGAKQSAG